MIIIGNKETYSFEGIHLPRIYIHDEKKVRSSLEILQKKGSLTNKEMTEETERVRSEDIREILYLLWKLRIGIDVSKKGREIVYLANEKLQSVLELNNNELKELLLEKLMIYNPFIAVLDKLIEYKNKSAKFTEKNVAKEFHNGRFDGGRIDNTHPLLRWSKDEDWGLVKNKEITERGIKYVNDAKNLRVSYIHHTVDLKASEALNIIVHIVSNASFENKKKIFYEDILGLVKNLNSFELGKKELNSYLKKLIDIGLPIKLKENEIYINSKIYHDITPKYYTKFHIHYIDGIDELETEKEEKIKEIGEKEVLKIYYGFETLIIHDEPINLSNYPNSSKNVSYREFLKINRFLPKLRLKNIILPPGWKPMKISKINGILLSFVKFGGNLLIFHAPMGRIGSNRNLFNWLPYDLNRISFVYNDSYKNSKGYFTFPFGENFMFTTKEKYEEISYQKGRYAILYTQYGNGLIIFVGLNPTKKFFKNYLYHIENKVEIDQKSKKWIYRYIPAINRLPGINTEYDLYPLLRRIMYENFGFKFDPEITGKPGQTDLFIETPLFCCCEVTPPRSNATGFSKVSEVAGHRQTMLFKDKKGKKKFVKSKVGACVLGPSFTIEAGADKAGAVDMANAMNISLISYRDLYELICLNEDHKLNIADFIKVFFNKEEKAEASLRIYELIIEKNKK